MAEPRFDSKQIGSPFKVSSLVSRVGTAAVTAYTDNVTTTIQLGGGTANTSTLIRAAASGTVNIGENTVVQTTNVGSTNGASVTTVRAGSGGLNVTATGSTLALAATGANIITLTTNSVEHVRITSPGTARFGASTVDVLGVPVGANEVVHTQINGNSFSRLMAAGAGVSNLLNFLTARGSLASPAALNSGDLIGSIGGQAALDGIGNYGSNASVQMYTDGAQSVASGPGRLVFNTCPTGSLSPVERVRIDNAGTTSFGDGTVASGFFVGNAAYPIHAYRNDYAIAQMTSFSAADAFTCPTVRHVRARGTAAAPVGVSADDRLGLIQWFGATGATTLSNAAAIQCYVDGTPGPGDMPGRLVFNTTPDGSATALERLRITNQGTLWIGDVSAANNTLNPLAGFSNLPVSSLRNGDSYWRMQSFDSAAVDNTSVFQGCRSRGTSAAPSSVTTGDFLFRISALGTLTSTAYDNGAHIVFRATQVWNTPVNSHGGDISFWTMPNATTGAPVERWSVAHNGHFLAAADNTYDIGALGATRPRNVYIGTEIEVGGFPVPRVLSVTSVNLKTVATTSLYTVPAGKTAIITDAVLRPTTATAAVGDAVMGIGVAAGEDDIFASQTLTGLNLTTERFKFLASGVSVTAAAAAVIKAGVDTADTGTALVADVYLIGYLI